MAKAPTATTGKALAAKDDDGKPAYLQKMEAEAKQGQRLNQDNFDQSDVALPRIKLLQATSKECEAFDSAKPGIFWHTGLDIPLSSADNPTLDFIIGARNKKWLLVAPLEDGQGILARADDFRTWDRLGSWKVKKKGIKEPLVWTIADKNVIESGLDQWGTYNPDDDQSPPAATLFYDYLVIMPKFLDLGPAIYTLTRSGITRAKKGLNDKIKLHEGNGRPMQSLIFRAEPTKEVGDEGDYKNVRFSSNGFASEELYNAAAELKGSLVNYKVQGEEEVASEEIKDKPKTSGSSDSKDF